MVINVDPEEKEQMREAGGGVDALPSGRGQERPGEMPPGVFPRLFERASDRSGGLGTA